TRKLLAYTERYVLQHRELIEDRVYSTYHGVLHLRKRQRNAQAYLCSGRLDELPQIDECVLNLGPVTVDLVRHGTQSSNRCHSADCGRRDAHDGRDQRLCNKRSKGPE